jgi:hypothetical protein
MDITTAHNAILAVTYLPGWTFEVEDGNHEGPWLRVNATVPDAYNQAEATVLDIHIPLGDILAIPDLTVDQLFSWLDARLMRIAEHEHHEWFQVNGDPWVDPHAEGYGLESRA